MILKWMLAACVAMCLTLQHAQTDARSQGLAGTSVGRAHPIRDDATRSELRAKIEGVRSADGYVYEAKDDRGHSLDCIKIIQNNSREAGPQETFIGVYHSYDPSHRFLQVMLAVSGDLLHWHFIRALSGDESGGTAQPAILRMKDGGFTMAWEVASVISPKVFIKVAYYKSWADLKQGKHTDSFNCPMTLSPCAEGTPNIYAATRKSVTMGFHYYSKCDVDRQAKGVLTNYHIWKTIREEKIDSVIMSKGVSGNIGDRDVITYQKKRYGLVEGQKTKLDFGTFNLYLYDFQNNAADHLHLITHGGSQALGNPAIAEVILNGKRALVISTIIFSQRSAPNEAGELIYYKFL